MARPTRHRSISLNEICPRNRLKSTRPKGNAAPGTTALPELLIQIEAPVARSIADSAYDTAPVSDLVETRFGDQVEVVIPPPKNAVPSADAAHDPTPRDRHIDGDRDPRQDGLAEIQRLQSARAWIDAQIGRWKAVIGPKLKARTIANQRTGVNILNRMSKLGRAEFERVA